MGLDVVTSPPRDSPPSIPKHNHIITRRGNDQERCNLSSSSTTINSFSDICRPKERRYPSPGHRSDQAQQFHCLPILCNNKPAFFEENRRSSMLDGLSRHKRCFSSCASTSKSPEISRSHMQQQTLFFQNPAFRPHNVHKNIHLPNETSSSTSACSGSSCHCLFG